MTAQSECPNINLFLALDSHLLPHYLTRYCQPEPRGLDIFKVEQVAVHILCIFTSGDLHTTVSVSTPEVILQQNAT